MIKLFQVTVLLVFAVPAMAQRSIDFGPLDWPADGNVVIPVAQGESLTGLAAELDARTNGAISMAAGEAAFIGEKGQTLTLFGIKTYARIDLIGLGDGPVDRVAAEDFGGLAASLKQWHGFIVDTAPVLHQ